MQEKAQLIEINNNEKEILKIAEVAAEILDRDNHIKISNSNAIPTIVDAFLKATVYHIDENKSKDTDYVIDLLGYIDMGVNYREVEDSENKGNFSPIADAGEIFKKGIKDNESTEDDEEA